MSNKCEFCMYRDMCSRYGEGRRKCLDFDIDREAYRLELARRKNEQRRMERLNNDLLSRQIGIDEQQNEQGKI